MNLIVTLSDPNYFDQAKQLFSSIHLNAQWEGECMVLGHELNPDQIQWFLNHGIQVKECKSLYKKKINRYQPTVTSKLYLFTQEMKKWDKIIYLDADIIVRKPLDELLKLEGFNVLSAREDQLLLEEFVEPKTKYQRFKFAFLKRLFDLYSTPFNSGVMVFSTSVIHPFTFLFMRMFLWLYIDIGRFGEQCILNLYFYKSWSNLPEFFNTFPRYTHDTYQIEYKDIDPAILHFADEGVENKPWNKQNPYYKEWKKNLFISDRVTFPVHR